MVEVFDHTADLGLRVRAADLDALFGEAAAGLFSVLVQPHPGLAAPETLVLALEAATPEYLLVDWLSELLYVFEVRRLVLGPFAVRVGDGRLQATARARALDLRRDRPLHEVKAVTYHGLRVEQEAGGWLAEVILDI